MAEALTDALNKVEDDKQLPKEAQPEEVKEDNFLNNLVGDGKKYKTPNELAKAYHHANIHIDELKSDLDEFKGGKELLNEVLHEIRSTNTDESEEAPLPQQSPAEPQIQTGDVAKIVDAEFIKREKMATAQSNVKSSMDKLINTYGTESQAKVAVQKAINGDDNVKRVIDDLSMTSPDSMVKFITGIAPAVNSPQSNTPGVNSESAPPSAYEGELTWSKCREIRKENPKLYNSQGFRKQIELAANKAAESGVDFFAN